MSDVTVYRVVQLDGRWAIKLAGDSGTEYAATKDAAVTRATELARRALRGAVAVVGPDGRIEQLFEVEPRRSA